MNNRIILPAMAMTALAPALHAQAWELSASLGFLSPRATVSQSGNPYDTRGTGRVASLDRPFRDVSLRFGRTLLSSGALRVKLHAVAGSATSSPAYAFRDVYKVDATSVSYDARGDLKLTVFGLDSELAISTAGAGEYGFALGARRYSMKYSGTMALTNMPTGLSPVDVSATPTAARLGFFAAYTQQFDQVGVVYRFDYGLLLGGPSVAASDLTDAEYMARSRKMVEIMMPRQDVRLGVGFRF